MWGLFENSLMPTRRLSSPAGSSGFQEVPKPSLSHVGRVTENCGPICCSQRRLADTAFHAVFRRLELRTANANPRRFRSG
jgi:hypothetical protein